MSPDDSVSLVRNRGFRNLWMGEAVSTLGSSFGTLAMTWLIYDATHSKTAMGGIWLSYLLPSLLVQMLAGPYLDRWNRLQVLINAQLARAILFGLLAILAVTSHVDAWQLYLAACLNGAIQALYIPSSMASLPMLVPPHQFMIGNSYLDGTSRLMMFLGPLLGGLLIAEAGVNQTLFLVVVAYGIGGYCLSQLLRSFTAVDQTGAPDQTQAADHVQAQETWWQQLQQGYRYFFQQSVLVWLGTLIAAIQFAVGVTMVINLPYVTDELGGDSFAYGLFIGGYPFGYFLGSLLLARLNLGLKRKIIMFGAYALGGMSFIALAVVHHLLLAVTIEVLSGLAAPFFHAYNTGLFQLIVPKALLGRIFSVRSFIIRCTMPLGVLAGGWLSEIWGTRPLFVMIGGFLFLLGLLGFALPLKMNRHDQTL